MIRFIFKQPQHRKFDFKPRYYNESKERLEARVAAVRREMEIENAQPGQEGLRSRMEHNWRRQDVKRASRSSNRNVFIIASLLVVIAYLILR
ncbi:MAG: hypothetical protein NWQ55_05730 [Salibacteraceae bacterium]|nr:hypothetical protein [Salibacteraceae bacterium]